MTAGFSIICGEFMKPRVLVFLGGVSREHDISMMTGAAIIASLPAAGYEPVPCVIGRDGSMSFPDAGDLAASVPSMSFAEAIGRIASIAPDCVFIGLHGTVGEDGRIQSLCDLMGLPYVGSDSIGSAVGIDKWVTKAVYQASGVPTPAGLMLQGRELDDRSALDAALDITGIPVVLKATREGSSFGVTIVRERERFDDGLRQVRGTSDMLVFEAYKKGREFSVPVLEDPLTGVPRTLPIIEIVVHKADFFDYGSKYDPAAADEVCPARVEEGAAQRMRQAALLAHRALMLSGYSRTDFILDPDGAIWALETNTLPGMTDKSLFPKAAAAAGISYPNLLSALVGGAIRRHKQRCDKPVS